jgi:hypothetical protein
MNRKSAARTFDRSKLVLWSALAMAAGMSELAYSLGQDRERGSYSSYDSYSNPISRPTHEFPAPAAAPAGQESADAAQAAATVAERTAPADRSAAAAAGSELGTAGVGDPHEPQ